MDIRKELQLRVIETKARDRLAIYVSDFIYAHGEDKDDAWAAMEYERWFADCCRAARTNPHSV
jgi:hypothetical protein